MSKNPSDYPEWLEAHPLRQWRRSRGLTIPQAAAELGWDANTVQFWETARRTPSLATMMRLAQLTEQPELVVRWSEWLAADPRERP